MLCKLACGDFQIDLDENVSAEITLEMLIICQGMGLISLREHTREPATSNTCIDTLYSNILFQLSKSKSTFSDQSSLQISFNIHHETAENFFEYRSMKKMEDLVHCEKSLFSMVHSLGKINEQNTVANHILTRLFKESTDKDLPVKEMNIREPKNPWITNCKKKLVANRKNFIRLGLEQNQMKVTRKTKKKVVQKK